MLFNSYSFVVLFLPTVLVGFYLLRHYANWNCALFWILFCSIYFYAFDEIRLLLAGNLHFYKAYHISLVGLILFSSVLNYVIGRLLSSRRFGMPLLVLGVCTDLGLLAYFKYSGLLVSLSNSLFSTDSAIPSIYLPLGISFHTFQQIAYLVDVYRGHVGEMSFPRYCVFVTFFPQVIAGPIVQHNEILPRLHPPRHPPRIADNLSIGITIFVLGLAKKVLLAESVAPYASQVFDATARGLDPSFLQAWIGILAYTLQIYFDFSAYSDMAIGIARMLGIRISINFDSPYKATSIIDFWRRWHITLSRFLRDYLYIPLGGSRKGKPRRYANLIITMLLGGLWHGANWTYMLWGGLHGMYLVINHAWLHIRGRADRSRPPSMLATVSARALTFFAVIIAWVFFKAGEYRPGLPGMETAARHDMQIAISMLKGMFGFHGFAPTAAQLSRLDLEVAICFALIVPMLAVVFIAPNTQQIMYRFRPALAWGAIPSRRDVELPLGRALLWHPSPARAFLLSLLFILCALFMARPSQFIYWQF